MLKKLGAFFKEPPIAEPIQDQEKVEILAFLESHA